MLLLGRLDNAKNIATSLVPQGYLNDIERMNLTLCKLNAHRALQEDGDPERSLSLVRGLRGNNLVVLRSYIGKFPITDSEEAVGFAAASTRQMFEGVEA